MDKIKIGIVGYGNLGKGVEYALRNASDMELSLIATRRPPEVITPLTSNVKVINIANIYDYIDSIDVMILCGGSATDLSIQGPEISKYFNTVDSFDNHEQIYNYYESICTSVKGSGRTCITSVGWDPGIFSMVRAISEAILPQGKTNTFWGKGVSQGHSDAIRRIKGVKNAVQYTIPNEEIVNTIKLGNSTNATTKEKHIRECYVVLEDNADANYVENTIRTMPNYFANYNTIIHFITEDELLRNHSSIPHGGLVIRNGFTGSNNENKHLLELSLQLDSNPEFTAATLVAFARAAYRMNKEGITGVKTILDVPPSYLSPKSSVELIKEIL